MSASGRLSPVDRASSLVPQILLDRISVQLLAKVNHKIADDNSCRAPSIQLAVDASDSMCTGHLFLLGGFVRVRSLSTSVATF